MLSFKSQFVRTTGETMTLSRLKGLEIPEAQALYDHPANQLIAGMQIQHIEQLSQSVEKIEKAVLASARELPYYAKLETLPGVGRILGMTITMEVGDIRRFAGPGNFASYCRAVEARRTSNDKPKGRNNSKCGNRYLAWAFVEAANFARRYDPQCRQWYDRKAARTSKVLATKTLTANWPRRHLYLMAEQVDYEPGRMFGPPAPDPVKT